MPYTDKESGINLDVVMNLIMQRMGADRRALIETINTEPYNFEKQDKQMADMRASLVALRKLGGDEALDTTTQGDAAPRAAVPREPEQRPRLALGRGNGAGAPGAAPGQGGEGKGNGVDVDVGAIERALHGGGENKDDSRQS